MADWTPSDLGSAVVAWFKADAGVTHSSGAVSQWASQVGSITADQATAGNKPTYSATGRNSTHAISFDGGDFLTLSALTGFPTGNAAGARFVVGYQGAASGNWRMAVAYGSTGGGEQRAIGIADNSRVTMDYWDLDVSLSSHPTWSTNDKIVYGHENGASKADLIANGDTTTDVDDASTGSRSTTSTRGRIGANAGTTVGDHWSGSLQEVLVFNRVLTADERERMEGYAAHKWGLTSLLPSGHPYKSSAPTTGATTHEGALTKAATSSETVGGQLVAAGAMTKAATSSETIGGQLVAAGAMTDAATSSETLGGQLVAVGAATMAATSDQTFGGEVVAPGAVTHEGAMTSAATSGETIGGQLVAVGAVNDAATAAWAAAGEVIKLGAMESAAVSSETVGGQLAAAGAMSSAATSAMTAGATQVHAGAVTNAATSDQTFRPGGWQVVSPTGETWTPVAVTAEIWTDVPTPSESWS